MLMRSNASLLVSLSGRQLYGDARMGKVHDVIRAYNALARIAAPALLFKSEAIVHPAEVARYIAPEANIQIVHNSPASGGISGILRSKYRRAQCTFSTST